MPVKISNLRPIQTAALRFLYDRRPSDFAFNEYLDRRHQELSQQKMRDLKADLVDHPFRFIHAHGSGRNWVLDTFLLDATPIRNEHPEHVAFAGLKCLLVYVTETMLRDGDLLARLLCEAEAQELLAQRFDLAVHVLRRGLFKTLVEHENDSLWSRYAVPAVWTTPLGQIETVSAQEIHETADLCIFESVIGITEGLTDVLLRAIYAIVIALSDLTTGRLHESIDVRFRALPSVQITM